MIVNHFWRTFVIGLIIIDIVVVIALPMIFFWS